MKNGMHVDCFDELKLKIISLVLLFRELKEEVVLMLITNKWILEDINLCESFAHLKEMVDISNNDLDSFVEKIYLLDNNSSDFYITDLKDEFEFIRENIHLEAGFATNMINYMVSDYTVNDSEIVERLEEYQEIDFTCYNQMKINNENLKLLRKERRDYFE